jgi:hypothetical protein
MHIRRTLMHRTTIMLPAELKARAAKRAKEMGISLGDLIRDALAAALRDGKKQEEIDPLFKDIVVYDGPAPKDGIKNLDHYLYDQL